MNEKDSNTKSRLYNLSILDDEYDLEKCADEAAYKIILYDVLDFQCYMQAVFDIANEFIKDVKLVEFSHLVEVFNNNIYIAKTGRIEFGKRIITDFFNTQTDEPWDPISYAKDHNQHIIDTLVSVDFNPQKLDAYFGNVYVGNCTGVINVIYNMISIPVHHNNYFISDLVRGTYREHERYHDYKEQIIELVRMEME